MLIGMEELETLLQKKRGGNKLALLIRITAVPYIFEIVIFVLLFELALIVFLNYPFPVFPFR